MSIDKKTIRKDILKIRNAILENECINKSITIENKIVKSSLYKEADIVLVYSSYNKEVGTDLIIEDALKKDKLLYLPKVVDNSEYSLMNFYRINQICDLENGYMGIKEPAAREKYLFDYENNTDKNMLMLVPGVAFDKECNRIGYGKGYYDNYLNGKSLIKTVGLAYSCQVVDILPFEENDKKLDFVVTEDTSDDEFDAFHF